MTSVQAAKIVIGEMSRDDLEVFALSSSYFLAKMVEAYGPEGAVGLTTGDCRGWKDEELEHASRVSERTRERMLRLIQADN